MFNRLIESKSLPHAILLTGRGKKALEEEAERLAYSLTNVPDLFLFRPEGKMAQHTMESMLSIRIEANIPCYLHDKKVFLIYEIDRIHPHASHALLKTFEEPPPGVFFILTTLRREKIVPTILSRFHTFWVAGTEDVEPLSLPLQTFLKTPKYTDSRPFFAGIKAITAEYDALEDPLHFQEAAEELWENLERVHPGKAPFFQEARLKLSRSTSLQCILESLFIKLGYL